jgi:Uma2 family endonuclease
MSVETPTASGAGEKPSTIPVDEIFRLSVERYQEIARSGILDEDDRVELLEGVLVAKMTKYPRHVFVGKRALKVIGAALPPGWHVAKEDPLATEDSVPEPDCMVLRGSEDDYRDRFPGPEDVALVVEISDTTPNRDRATKRRIYARVGIAFYWIVNLVSDTIEVHSDPSGPSPAPGYRTIVEYRPGDHVPLVLDGQEVGRVAARDLLS